VKYFFDRLKIDVNAKKTKTHQYSTGEEVLAQLADKHEIVPMILEYRGLKKLLNTYVEALPMMVNPRTGKSILRIIRLLLQRAG